MDDLVQFLRARLDEDEQTAQAATPGPWAVDGASVYVGHPTNEVVDYSDSAEHIARHDPARVLAEVDAKRKIVGLHELEYRERPDRVLGEADDAFCAECCAGGFPCDTLRLLALPYADHPNYRDDWRPTA